MRPRQTLNQRPDSGLSTATLSAAEGDDLLRARQFCQQASSEMTAIIAADRAPSPLGTRPPRQGRDPIWLCERLSIIQSGAKRARARAVYRSAQDVLGLIHRQNAHMPIDWTRVDGRLFVLNKLLGQYETGLNEIAPEAEAGAASPDDREMLAETEIYVPFDPVEAMARDTLQSLLPHASESEQAALKRLMDYQPDLDRPNGTASTRATDTLEHVLPDLVQNLLEVGREYGKILSVSHSLDDLHIAEGTAPELAQTLFQTLSELVASNLPLQGVGRLDIAPSEKGLRISGSGFETFEIALSQEDMSSASEAKNVQEVDDRPSVLDDISETEPAPKPRINDDTEADLRAQLAALMDGGVNQI